MEFVWTSFPCLIFLPERRGVLCSDWADPSNQFTDVCGFLPHHLIC